MTDKTPSSVVGSGITYDDQITLVETIVSMKKTKYNFPGVDSEDLAQDIRVMCWQAIEHKFDHKKLGKSLFHFVARVVDNALYNKFRGVYLDNNPPCLRCEHYIKEDKSCAIEEVGCTRIVSYRDRMSRKRAIAAPLSYNAHLDADSENDYTHHASMSVGSLTGVCDLDDTLRHELDDVLIPYYEQMLRGEADLVPHTYRKLIQRQVKAILDGGIND